MNEGLVYFIQASDGLIKIGWSKRLSGRLKALRTSHPRGLSILAVCPGTMADEKSYHRQFADHHVAGEWFRPAPALLSVIEEVARSSEVSASDAADYGCSPDDEEQLFVAKAAAWVKRIIDIVAERESTSRGAAASIAEHEFDLPSGLIYSLTYRLPATISAGQYTKVQRAFIAAASQHSRAIDERVADARLAPAFGTED